MGIPELDKSLRITAGNRELEEVDHFKYFKQAVQKRILHETDQGKDWKRQSGIHEKEQVTDAQTESRLTERTNKVLCLEHRSVQIRGVDSEKGWHKLYGYFRNVVPDSDWWR